MEWLNPYKNMHPTLIPKIKPLTIHKKAKYTGQRPEKFSSKEAANPNWRAGRGSKFSSADPARENALRPSRSALS